MMRAGVCLLTLAVATVACSSKSGTKPGDGGTGGTGGSDGGSTSTCGKNVTAGCTSTNTDQAPANGVIADFMSGDGGLTVAGGLTTYGGIAAPTYVMNTGSVDLMEAAGTSPNGPQYAGFVLFFNNCVNACAFKGVSFSIKGTITGCTMQFSTNFTQDVCNDGTTSSDPKGSYRFDAGTTCPAYSPQLNLKTITSTAQTIQVAFDDAMLIGGVPNMMVDNGHITGVQWQFTIPAAGDGGPDACIANINISNVKFYQ
jgi:hypothetical protein